MQARIKSLHLESFGRHSEAVGGKTLDFELGHKTIISGSNRTGKSTIKRAIQYILGCKDENGKEIAGIRPHDDNGVDIDGLTTIAEMTICVDGMENTLKRTCFQEKNRQGEYTGKDNLQYFVDDVRKGTKKAYEEFIGKFFPEAVCMSAQEFLSKDTAGRRAMLEVFNNHDAESIISENAEFEPLRAKLNANTIADLKTAFNEKIHGKGRGVNHVDGLEDEQKKIIHRIEFEESQKVDIDVAELELLKNSLNEQIAENKAKQEDVSKEFEEQQKASDGILELKFELNDLQRKENEELVKQKKDLQSQIDEKNEYLMNIGNGIQRNNREIADYEREIELAEKERKRLLEQWNAVNSEVFDENTAICPTCHRELPSDERERLLSAFEKSKAERLAAINKKGLEVKTDIENAQAMIPKLQECNKDNLSNKEKLEKEVADLEKQLSKLPDSIDISDRPEVQEIQRQIAEKEKTMNKGNSASEMRGNLQSQLEDLQSQLMEVNSKLALAKRNVEIDEQIADLQKQQRAKSQEIADVEKELDLLKQFERKKSELLESDVNSWFDYVQIKMSEIQQNGEQKDVCLITVNGESYDRNLNHGSKMLAEIDICMAFQRKYGVVLPIILDDTESLNPWDIPDIENQIIMLRWSADKELKIEMEG